MGEIASQVLTSVQKNKTKIKKAKTKNSLAQLPGVYQVAQINMQCDIKPQIKW